MSLNKNEKISDINVQKRLNWCKKYQYKGKEFWRSVLFTDEKIFYTKFNDTYLHPRLWSVITKDFYIFNDFIVLPVS